MSKIVVAKLVRLGKNGDRFDKKMIAKEERTSVKIDNEQIEMFNKNWEVSGRLYVIDEEATKERNKLFTPKDMPDRDELKKEAESLGIEFKGNIKTKQLIELINQAKK